MAWLWLITRIGSYAISLIVINTERQVGKKGRHSGRLRREEARKQRDLTVPSLLAARDQRDCVRAREFAGQ